MPQNLNGVSPALAARNATVVGLASRLIGDVPGFGERLKVTLDRVGLATLSRLSADDLTKAVGGLRSECELLVAAFELGRCVEIDKWSAGEAVRTSKGVYLLMAPLLRGLPKETFYVLLLDGRHRLTGCQRVSEGTLTTSLVHPREVFGHALRDGAAAIIVVHNHPSGDPEPSQQDYDVTRRLARAGRLLGVPLLDHVVIGHGDHVSIRERIEF